MLLVPAGDQFVRRLADHIPVPDLTPEVAGGVEPVLERLAQPVGHIEDTVQPHLGCIRAQPFQLDRPPSQVEGRTGRLQAGLPLLPL